ncbi:MAG: hypothetical protein IT366_18435 [Candidatus Hydrogenedentes bacterium]|nr:hypothetical protein [Candidatus Hydrogenedentota bacterium]
MIYQSISSKDRSWAALRIAGLLAGILICFAPASFSDGMLVLVADPLAEDTTHFPLVRAAAPAPGASLRDERLGTIQTRVTSKPGLRHEYARHDPFNKDCSLILLTDITAGAWLVFKTSAIPFDKEGGLLRQIDFEEPRWDGADPRVIWGTRDFSILRMNVDSWDVSVVKDFTTDPVIGPILKSEPDLYRITMKDEGEASLDRRYWAFIVQGAQDDYRARYILVWDRTDDKVIGLMKLAETQSRIDWVGMSPKGTWVIVGSDHDNGSPLAGLVMLDRALKRAHPLHYSTGHADVGIDATGREVVVMQNAQTDFIDLIPLDEMTKSIPPGGSYEGTNHVPLLRLFYASDSTAGFNSGVHISCNYAGWCVVSTHIEPGVAEKNWLDRSIVLVRLDPSQPRAYYVAKVHGTCSAYWEETHAAISADGARIVWATNWNQNVGQEKVWLVECPLPKGWQGGPATRSN